MEGKKNIAIDDHMKSENLNQYFEENVNFLLQNQLMLGRLWWGGFMIVLFLPSAVVIS